jgi:hypothetical protein
MNRLTNSFLLVLFFPALALAIFVGFDFPLEFIRTSGANLPYKDYMFGGLALLMAILAANRSIRRWVALFTIRQTDRFVFHAKVSNERRKRVIVYTLLEAGILTAVGIALYVLSKDAILCSVVFLASAIDNLLFLIIGLPRFGVGLSKKAIIVADREVIVLYFSGLRKVSLSQETLFFDYIQSLQLTFPVDCIPEEDRNEFLHNLEAVTDKDRVFIQNLGEWKM